MVVGKPALHIVGCGAVPLSSTQEILIACLWSCKTTQNFFRYYQVSLGGRAQNCLLLLENHCSQQYIVFYGSTCSCVCRWINQSDADTKPCLPPSYTSRCHILPTVDALAGMFFSCLSPLRYSTIYSEVTPESPPHPFIQNRTLFYTCSPLCSSVHSFLSLMCFWPLPGFFTS